VGLKILYKYTVSLYNELCIKNISPNNIRFLKAHLWGVGGPFEFCKRLDFAIKMKFNNQITIRSNHE